MNLKDRIQHAWNAFTAKESGAYSTNGSSSYNPAHRSVRRFNNASYVSAIFNRIALDVATTTIQMSRSILRMTTENIFLQDLSTA